MFFKNSLMPNIMFFIDNFFRITETNSFSEINKFALCDLGVWTSSSNIYRVKHHLIISKIGSVTFNTCMHKKSGKETIVVHQGSSWRLYDLIKQFNVIVQLLISPNFIKIFLCEFPTDKRYDLYHVGVLYFLYE